MPSPSEPTRSVRVRIAWLAGSAWPVRAAVVGVLVGLGLLVAAMVPVGPEWLGGVGAVLVATVYSWALAAREGGRPVVFGTLGFALAVAALVVDHDLLRAGAAVSTAAVAAVLGVMITVPTPGYLAAAREAAYALVVAGIGAMASVGFEPAIDVVRYEYVTLAWALAGVLIVVYRLGAGFHGLGRRGLIAVVIGAVLMSVLLLYAELLRRYGAGDLVADLLDAVRWSRDNLGAFPRPISAVLGVPALVYGVHLRSRRRQGWWVCAFGVTGTASTATALGNPSITSLEALLSVVYGLVVGVLLGWLIIRIDTAITGGSRGRGSRKGGGRRVAAAQADDVVSEPGRTAALL